MFTESFAEIASSVRFASQTFSAGGQLILGRHQHAAKVHPRHLTLFTLSHDGLAWLAAASFFGVYAGGAVTHTFHAEVNEFGMAQQLGHIRSFVVERGKRSSRPWRQTFLTEVIIPRRPLSRHQSTRPLCLRLSSLLMAMHGWTP